MELWPSLRGDGATRPSVAFGGMARETGAEDTAARREAEPRRRKKGWNGLLTLRQPAGLLYRHQVGGVMTLKSCYESMKERNQQLSN